MADEEDLFSVQEETHQHPSQQMPKPVRVQAEDVMVLEESEESNEEDDESYYEIVEPFTTTNGYVFSLVAVQDEEGDKFVAVQLDNATIELPLQDVIEMISGFGGAIPKLLEESKKD